MVVNFRVCGISQGARKLARTFTLIIIKKMIVVDILNIHNAFGQSPPLLHEQFHINARL
jgi:hypothetical protein